MKQLLLALFLYFLSTLQVFAQILNYDIGFNVLTRSMYHSTFSHEQVFNHNWDVEGLTIILFENTSTINFANRFASNLGLEITSGIDYKLKNDLGLHIGLGVNSLNLKVFTGIDDQFFGEFVPFDTIPITEFDFANSRMCDSDTVSMRNHIPINFRADYDMVNLRIPIELFYTLIKQRLKLRVGGYFQVPLFAKRNSEEIIFRNVNFYGEYQCIPETIDEEASAHHEIKSVRLGLNFGIQYEIAKNFAITTSLQKELQNVFDIPDIETFRLNRNSNYRPARFAFGIKYLLHSR